jgi:biopolymer transport protein ExbD
MPIPTRNKLSSEFSMASMSDLAFLVLIFFLLSSTLVAPNAIKLLLPSSSSRTLAKQSVTIYIDDRFQYYVEEYPVAETSLETEINGKIAGQIDASVVLRSDKTVPVQYIVTVIDAVNNINTRTGTNHKVILATSPKE